MTTLIHIEQFPQTSQLVAELRSEFAKGADTLVIVDNDQILGTFLSREATQKALAQDRRAVGQEPRHAWEPGRQLGRTAKEMGLMSGFQASRHANSFGSCVDILLLFVGKGLASPFPCFFL